jgi:PIN domain nuclease of toxin-antitoxin system
LSLLLDTHVLLWWLEDSPSLASEARAAIADEPTIFVSAATIWEISIKASTGKLRVTPALLDYVEQEGFQPLPISLEHAFAAGSLPPHHNDPFDRMLVAQAAAEALTIVTRNPRIGAYGVPTLRA